MILAAATTHWLDAPLTSPYRWTMVGAIVLSAWYWMRKSRHEPTLLVVYIGALGGAFLGAKLAYVFSEGWRDWPMQERWLRLAAGKSIVGGLLGGYAGVEFMKWIVGYRKSTGDLFAFIVPLGIALGRLGCWLQGCCLGKPTRLKYLAVCDQQGVARWPASQMELLFQLFMFGVLLILKKRGGWEGRLFFLYLLCYGVFRFFHEFLRDTPAMVLGLSGYQILSAVMALIGGVMLRRRALLGPNHTAGCLMAKPDGLRLPAGHALCDVTAGRMDIAFFRNPDGRAWMGEGPFAESVAPGSDAGFYINDFTLSDPKPWKTPARLTELKGEGDLSAWLKETAAPHIAWSKPQHEGFKMVFRRIRRDVQAQRVRKMVPVLTEYGELESGAMIHLLRRVLQAPLGFWAYARVKGGEGFLGATPELLLHRLNSQLETMALAGTARPSGGAEFAADVKEIEEHEIVADFIDGALKPLGAVQRGSREISHAGGLTHFRTSFRVDLNGKRAGDDEQIRLLHPTPAVGCLPRDEASLARLMEYRRQLEAPDFFGAPFGFHLGEEFQCVVAIRGVSWEGTKVALPCGCGIVGASSFDHEWRELRQKRDAVAGLLEI